MPISTWSENILPGEIYLSLNLDLYRNITSTCELTSVKYQKIVLFPGLPACLPASVVDHMTH